MPRSTLTLPEALVVATLCFGLFTVWSLQAVLKDFPEAAFSESSNTWSILIEAMLASLGLLYLRARNFDIASLYPKPDLSGTAQGLALFVAAGFAGLIATMPFDANSQTQMAEFSFGDTPLASTVIFAMVNGTYEEVFLLGVLVRGLRSHGLSVAIGLPLLIRLLYHLYQGPMGAVWIVAFGLTFTLFYLRNGRLWPAVFAHILWDIVPVLMADS